MTTEHEASRTLVKSPPELWAECSDAGSLARHLGEFGDITITRLEPETTVAWEGEHVSGTVRIEPSGWGTRVTLTAQARTAVTETEPATEMVPAPAEIAAIEPLDEEETDATVEETPEEPVPAVAADAGPLRIRWRRMTRRVRGLFQTGELVEPAPDALELAEGADPVPSTPEAVPEAVSIPAPEPAPEVQVEDRKEPAADADPEVILTAALESLGQAHHRPFSRA